MNINKSVWEIESAQWFKTNWTDEVKSFTEKSLQPMTAWSLWPIDVSFVSSFTADSFSSLSLCVQEVECSSTKLRSGDWLCQLVWVHLADSEDTEGSCILDLLRHKDLFLQHANDFHLDGWCSSIYQVDCSFLVFLRAPDKPALMYLIAEIDCRKTSAWAATIICLSHMWTLW